MSLKEGAKAPAFALMNQNHQKVKLTDSKDSWVILYFYPKDSTPGCTQEAKDFSKMLKDFHRLKAVVYGVSPDSVESHQKFIDKYKLKVDLLSDEDKKVLKTYKVWQKKKLYGREFMGVVRSTFIIDPKGKIAALWPKVKVNGHSLEVKKRLQELQNKV